MSGTRATQRAWPTWRGLTLVAIVIAMIVGWWAAPTGTAVAGNGTPMGGEGQTARLRLVEQTAWVDPDGEFTLRVTVEDPPPGSTIEVTVHDRLTGRIQFSESLDGVGFGPVTSRRCAVVTDDGLVPLDPCVSPAAGDALDADGAMTFGLPVRSTAAGPSDRILLTGDGVYPIRVTLSDADGIPVETLVTHLLRLPDEGDDSPPIAVSVVVPFHAPVARQPDGSLHIDPEEIARLDDVVDALHAHPDVAVVLVPTPETLRALSEDPSASTLLDRLRESIGESEVLAQPYVGVDVGSWWLEGLDVALDDLFDAGHRAVDSTLGVTPDTATWLVGPTTDPATLARLRQVGVSQVVVPELQLGPLDQALFPLALDRPFAIEAGDGALVPAVMDDAALSGHAGSTGDAMLDAHHLLADLLLLYTQQPGIPRGIAFHVPSDDLDPVFLRTVLSGLDQPAPVRGATVADLLASADAARVGGSSARVGDPLVRPVLTTTPDRLGSYPEDRHATIENLVPYRALMGEDADLEVVEDLIRVSGAQEFDAASQRAYLDGATAQVAVAATAVTTPEQAAVTLAVREGRIPIVVLNALEHPVEVAVRLESDKLEYPDGQTRIVTLESGENRLEWLVRARASGAFPVDVVVTSPDGSLELDSTRFTMRSTAVPGIGIALSVIAALFLALWWARHWRSTRRAVGLVTPGDDGGVQGGSGADDVDRMIEEITRI